MNYIRAAVIIFIGLFAVHHNATAASETCRQVGNAVYCNGTDSNGNYYSYSCRKVGSSTYCS